MGKLEITRGIKTLNPEPIDGWSGPYEGATEAEAITAALAGVPEAIRYRTMQLRLIIAGAGKLYWFHTGTGDEDLVEHLPSVVEDLTAEINDLKTRLTAAEAYIVTFNAFINNFPVG